MKKPSVLGVPLKERSTSYGATWRCRSGNVRVAIEHMSVGYRDPYFAAHAGPVGKPTHFFGSFGSVLHAARYLDAFLRGLGLKEKR